MLMEGQGASEWVKRQWDDIRGNAKWAAMIVIGNGFMILAVALTHGLQLWQQVALSVCFVFLFGWAMAATFTRDSRILGHPVGRPQHRESPLLSQADRAM